MADNISFTSHEEEDLNASWGRDIDWGMQGRLQLSNPDRKNGEYFASFPSSYSSLSAALSPNGAHASAFDACAAPQPDVTSSPNRTMALSDPNHSPTPSTARSLSFPHPPTCDVAPAWNPSVSDHDCQHVDPLALVPVRTSNSTPSSFRHPSSHFPADILSIPAPMNIPSAGLYADPYAGVILAAPCPTGCPLCSSSNTPRSEYVDGSVTKAHINTPFSHPEPPEEPSPRLPLFSSVSGDTAALPSSFRDTPGLHDDSNVWRPTDEKECGDTPDVPYLWPSSPSPSSSTTFAQGELSSAVTSARQRNPAAASPDLAIVQPIPRYGSFSRSNDHNDDYDSNVAKPPLLCSYFPSLDATRV